MAVGYWLGRLRGVGGWAPAAWDAWLGHVICAGLETNGGDDLGPVSDSDGEGAWPAAQNRIGAVVEQATGAG